MHPMASLNYNHLRYFRAVAHEGNLTRAAGLLNLSQSALSVQLKKLEERLGYRLFERSGKQLLLTEAGRVALDYADAIFAAGDELLATLSQQAASRRQHLRVGALSTLSRNFQIEFLRPLIARDDAGVSVRSGRLGELIAALEAHELDIVLTNTVPARDDDSVWLAHPIDEQPVALFGTPDRVGRGRDLQTLLQTEPLAVPSPESSIRAGFDALIDRLGLHPRIAAAVDDMAMLRLLAREGAGLAVIPPIVVQDELAAGTLIRAEALPGLSEHFYAITLARRFPNPLLSDVLSQARVAL